MWNQLSNVPPFPHTQWDGDASQWGREHRPTRQQGYNARALYCLNSNFVLSRDGTETNISLSPTHQHTLIFTVLPLLFQDHKDRIVSLKIQINAYFATHFIVKQIVPKRFSLPSGEEEAKATLSTKEKGSLYFLGVTFLLPFHCDFPW